tara:strand:- start:5608 stop:6741 length:1134 start_codon:yes stop_codon:yes gene_type:complete
MFREVFFISFLLFCCACFCQEDINCGTEVSEKDKVFIQHFINEIKFRKQFQTPLDSIVPVKFHIVGYNNGADMIDSVSVFNELNSVNSFYSSAGIRFQHCGPIDYIQDSEYALFEKINDETLCDITDIVNVLNIYFVPRLYKISSGDTVNLCGYAYLTGVNLNRIVMKNSCSTNGSTLSHEIGHYFSLFHTHSSSNGAELVNGSNCTTAGDLFCDTPADPGLSSSTVTSSCIYVGNEQDANGDFYSPDVNNFMSYSRKSCRDFFSNEQLTRMNDYFVGYRNYLLCPFDIDSSLVSENLDFILYPNPSGSLINLIYVESNQLNADLYLTVHDLSGRLLFENTITTSFSLNVQNYCSGVYFITLSNQQQKLTKKYIKSG